MRRWLLLAAVGAGCSRGAPSRDAAPEAPPPVVAEDDAHNHDGSHPDGPVSCGTDEMLPGHVARLGSHSFVILGRDGADHVIAEHRSGTPPHNYQIVLRLRLDPDEMAAYERIARASRTLPAFTTIWFDESGQQVDRTFFCLGDLPTIPTMRATWQQDADHEGTFDIKKSITRDRLTIEPADVEIRVDRYLPAYLPQDVLRQAIRDRTARLGEAPPAIATPARFCQRNTFLRGEPVPETTHTFLLVAAAGAHAVIATHLVDPAPQNFQTAVTLTLDDAEMAVYRHAAEGTTAPPRFETSTAFCMEDLRKGTVVMRGSVYRGSTEVGDLDVAAADVQVLVNRRLESFLDPFAVARDVWAGAR